MVAAQGSVSVEAREEREREGAEQGVSSQRAESESEVEVLPGEGSGEERGQLSRGRPWVFPRHHETPVLDP